MTKKELIEERAEAHNAMKAIHAAAEKERRVLTPDESTDFARLEVKFDRLTKQIDEIERGGGILYAKDNEPAPMLARMARHLKTGKGAEDYEKRAEFTSSDGSAAVQDPVLINDWLLTPLAANDLGRAGVRFEQQVNHTRRPKVTARPSVAYIAEGNQITHSEPTLTSIDWDFFDLAAICVVQNQLLYDALPMTDNLIQQLMIESINDEILRAVFHGAGTTEPDGIDNYSAVLTVAAGGAAMDDFTWLSSAVRQLMAVNVPLDRISFFSHPYIWAQIADMVDNQAQNRLMPEQLRQFKYFYSSKIETGLNDSGLGTNDETRIYAGSFNDLIVGFQPMVQMRLVERYSDYLQTGFLVHMRLAIKPTFENHFCIIKGVQQVAS